MDKTLVLLLIHCFLPFTTSLTTNEVGSGATDYCPPENKTCHFVWTVENKHTMVLYEGIVGKPVVWRNGSFISRGECDEPEKDKIITLADLKNVITADGTYKYIHTINHSSPGPSVVVYEGQEVVIKVTNHFWQQGTGIHWHGIVQRNTNWMDGIPGITQCAINPHETFTYRFYADPVGTHWYHSHEGLQRNDGLYGAFIVLPKPESSNQSPKHSEPPIPTFHKDFIMLVTDWFASKADQMMTTTYHKMKSFLYNRWNGTSNDCFGSGGRTPDGKSAGQFLFQSALINGKGFVDDGSGVPPLTLLPLETYIVEGNQHYRFRVINAGATYQFKISVDNHPLTIIASDGQDLTPVQADSFFIANGERFDFYINTNQTPGNYWIRAVTIEITPHQGLAILRYKGSPDVHPTSKPTCMGTSCIVVNCPFRSFIRGPSINSTCLNFESLTSRTPSTMGSENFKEHFISLVEPLSIYGVKYDTINGVMFVNPSTPPATIGRIKYDKNCQNMDCRNKPCQCTNQINISLGDTVQLVIFANQTHPMHLHGHWFEVIKMGYPPNPAEHDARFRPLVSNQDVKCNNIFCNAPYWANSSWNNNSVPGTNLVNPPKKDTISIPGWGYAVVRFKADNPGWWFLHCHVEKHMHDGMAILFQSGREDQMKLPPKGFPQCGSFDVTHQELEDAMMGKNRPQQTPTTTTKPSKEQELWTKREKDLMYGYIGAILGGLFLGISVTVACYTCRASSKS